MNSFQITFIEQESRTIMVRADEMATAMKFVEDGGFYHHLPQEELQKQFPGVEWFEDHQEEELLGRRVVRIEEVE